MRMLMVADPVAVLKPASDTTMACARSAAARGIAVDWAERASLFRDGTQTMALAAQWESDVALSPRLGAARQTSLESYQVILIRPNPPFDIDYISLCWWLLPYASRCVISNAPHVLLTHHEKMVPWLMHAAGALPGDALIPTIVTTDPVQVRRFATAHAGTGWVIKPWLGFGGNEVARTDRLDELLHAVASSPHPVMVQPFLPEIVTAGDRRVLFVGGAMVGDFVRMPPAGGFVSNLAQGGNAVARELTPAQRVRCAQVGAYLRTAQIDFAGVDLIGDVVSEVNITSPTGVQSVAALSGADIAGQYVDYLQQRVKSLTKE